MPPKAQKVPYTRTTVTGIYENIEYQIVKNPRIYFGGKNINTSDPDCEVRAIDMVWRSEPNGFDGEIGVQFIKNIGLKCIIDFDSMTVECKY